MESLLGNEAMSKSRTALYCLLLLTGVPAFSDTVAAADPRHTPDEAGDSRAVSALANELDEAAVTLAISEIEAPAASGLEGLVIDREDPISQATVYAYEVASSRLIQVTADAVGRFFFDGLPAGMYKLVAFKPGFKPTVELLLRRRPEDRQFVEMKLEPRAEQALETPAESPFWTVRGRVPMDVLRQMDALEPPTLQADLTEPRLELPQTDLFTAEMQAFSGVENLGPTFGDAQLTAAEVGVRAHLGSMGVGIDGIFRQLTPDSARAVDGSVTSVAVHLEPTADQQVRVAGTNGRLALGLDDPVDLSHYQVDWSGRTGRSGSARVSARYVQRNNYSSGIALQPSNLSLDSQTWGLEGSYTGQLSDSTSLEAGLVYHQRSLSGIEDLDERIGLYTTAGSQLQSRVFVEYGLYSSMSDGSLSLVPHGSVVVRLGDNWSAQTSASRRFEQEDDPLFGGHQAALFSDPDSCRSAGRTCYQISLSREDGDESFSLGAIHREFSETLQLYFSQDFFNRLESVFLVRGDELPEIKLSVVRRLTPKTLTRLESNFASGGGGIFYAANQAPYENEVRYLVTSVDTHFQRTATGLLMAFHHLEQALNPVIGLATTPDRVELQRLQLMLTQDLNVLADLASKWAVSLNMELSRGATPYAVTADDRTYRKLTGGFSVSF